MKETEWIKVDEMNLQPYTEYFGWLMYKECPDIVHWDGNEWTSQLYGEVHVSHVINIPSAPDDTCPACNRSTKLFPLHYPDCLPFHLTNKTK